jgi:hypothetical protein
MRLVMYATISNLFAPRSCVIDSDTCHGSTEHCGLANSLLVSVREVLGSSVGTEIGYADWFFFCFCFCFCFVISSVPPAKCSETCLKRNLGLVEKLSLAKLSEVLGPRSAFR